MRKFRTRRAIATALGAIALCAAIAIPPRAGTAQSIEAAKEVGNLSGAALVTALRNGGYVLYFRHTATDFGQNDEEMTSFEDCPRQRNLTEAGRADARAIGASLRQLDIPIGEVLASPYCRTRETAMLIFGRATVALAVRGGPAQADDARYAGLKALLAKRVAGGVNLAIVSHGNPYRAIAGGPYLAEGEAAVMEPRGADGFRVIGRIRKDGWAPPGASR